MRIAPLLAISLRRLDPAGDWTAESYGLVLRLDLPSKSVPS